MDGGWRCAYGCRFGGKIGAKSALIDADKKTFNTGPQVCPNECEFLWPARSLFFTKNAWSSAPISYQPWVIPTFHRSIITSLLDSHMKFTCTQENLSQALGLVSRVASKNVALPILHNVLMTARQGGV